MQAQVNFKTKTEQKTKFLMHCYKKDIDMARCLRALSIAFSEGKIPSKVLKYALLLEAELNPETRGRKPKLRKTNTAKRLLKRAA